MYLKLINHSIIIQLENTLTRHETLTKAFSIFKFSAMITPIFGIIIISVIIFLCCRTKKIGQLVSLLSLTKVTKAGPNKGIRRVIMNLIRLLVC